AHGREIVVADIQGYVHFLSRESGAFVGRVATDGSPVSTSPVSLPNGGCLIQTRNGGLYAFDTESKERSRRKRRARPGENS
ncbi:MAG: hypothetical protein MUP61_04155, partial [Burkholderiales bacterium]|nr:hypothetical protein [Burkholderiales bacterium]